MRRFAAVAGAALLAVTAISSFASAGASVPVKDAKFCAAVAKLGEEIDALPADTEGIDEAAARKSAKAIRKAAKSAPKKVRKAMNVIAGTYDRLADGDSIADVIAEDAGDFAKASAIYGIYYAKNCIELPEVPEP